MLCALLLFPRIRNLSLDKILLVDDVKLLREIQKGLLSSSSVQVLTACDGLEALEIARREIPNLIVMDNHMPNMDGVTCCREIKSDPLLRKIPVIMLTNAVSSADLEVYRAAGAVDCLSKPIDGKLFLITLKKHLSSVECRGIRVPISTAVRLNANGVVYAGMARDISLKGINVTSEYHLSPGEVVRFDFVLPGSDAPTEVRGKVAWVRKKEINGMSGLNYECGIEFLEITGKGIPFIRKNELEIYVSRQAGVATANMIG